eukprot:1777473-Alexandrium_andersonii.AAC.1
MSASLVGSEMCIRDSPRRSCCCSPSCRTPQCSSGSRLTRSDLERTLPVSYTHLTLPTICSV